MTIDGIYGDVLFESNVFLESKKLKLPRYTLKPGFFGDMMVEIYCFQDEGRDSLKVMTNIPYVYYTHSPYAYCSGYFRSEDDYIVNIQSFYVCKGVAYREPYSRNVVQDCRMLKRREGLGFGIEITRDMAINNVDFQISDTGLEEYADFFPSNISLQQLINDYKIVERFDECKERVRRNYGYRLSSSSYRRSSSSSEEESSSSQTESSSSEKEDIASSSSIQINLSSSKIIKVSSSSMDEESSSSMEIEIVSSSAKKESSSSALVETSSSSRQAVSSSSDFVYSSSDDGVFVAGGDREYTPDQIFKDGLDNMEDGKCYSLNPARGTQRGWINTNAQDSWWWREVDCETGNKVDNNRVGSCPGFPLDNVPSNPKNACFAYNGTCYKCNPARGSECSNSWLWQGSFTSSNVGWWYEEVDCYDPFGEEDVIAEGCIDESFLKKEAVGANYQKVADDVKEYYADLMMTSNKYDALGRMRNHGSTQRMAYFNKKIPYKEEKDSRSNLLVSGTIVASSDTLCNRLSSGEWVCGKKNILAKRLNDDSEFNDSKNCNIKLRRNYGIVENGNLVGGMTCAWPKVITSKAYNVLNRERLTDEYIKIIVHYTITSKTILGDNDHLTVKKGYVFPNGHVTTSAEEKQFDKHEDGHEFNNKCVTFEEINTAGQFECSVKLKAHWSQKKKDETIKEAIAKELKIIENPLIENKVNEGQNKLDAMVSRFHKDHGIGGYSDHYTCPTN